MTTVLLRLEGPLQAWATQSQHGVRDTDREPSKSGVLGLVGAALGMPRDDDRRLGQLAALDLAVRVDRPGSLLRDFHTAGGGRFRGDPRYTVHDTKSCVPTTRFYLQGASFVAALGGDADLVAEIAAALERPVWPLYLGRRSCPPSVPVLIGTTDTDVEAAVRGAAVADRPHASLRLVLECSPDEGDLRLDVPISFREGARRYGHRYVRSEWMDSPPETEA